MNETKEAIIAGLETEDRHRKFVYVANSTDTRSVSSSDRALTDISDEKTNRRTYSELSEEQAPNLPPWEKYDGLHQVGRYKLKPEKKLDVPELRVIEPVKDRFTTAVDYRN